MIPLMISAIENPDDREFMEFLYISFNRLMYSEIRKYVSNDWDIEDIMQTVLINLIGKVQKLRGFDRSQRVNYIIVASRNTALNFLRDSKRATQFSYDEDLDWLDDKFPSGEETLELIELQDDVDRAWRALDERSRRILEMKYTLGKSNEEIGRELGVSPDSVRMLLTRARKKMKKFMGMTEIV